jgi:hypothetical protein
MCANKFPVIAQPSSQGDPSDLLEQAANAGQTEFAGDPERSGRFWTGLKKARHKHLESSFRSLAGPK